MAKGNYIMKSNIDEDCVDVLILDNDKLEKRIKELEAVIVYKNLEMAKLKNIISVRETEIYLLNRNE